ncbi:CoA-disulfide reductase [Aeromonas tecta]|uniref:CoA-disulfide reductase n=1 Tax=Aeromonas tecta TaxID=324617 RepID=UPI000683186B|nr:CoA-disulfide reductase [Aeromonas tecta]
MRIVIIGGEAAGMSAAAKARRLAKDAEIVVYEASEVISFGACGLPYFVGDDFQDPGFMAEFSVEQFAAKGIEVKTGHRVSALDPNSQTITVEHNGDSFSDHYDRLMIATGAREAMPPIPGLQQQGVFGLRRMADGLALKAAVRDGRKQKAVVIGSGFIGLEVVEALVHQGKEVRLIELAERVIPDAFDSEITQHLETELREQGVSLHLGERVEALLGEGGVTGVRTNQGVYEADIVVVCTGVRPNTEFLAETGIKRLVNGAIEVDRQGRSSLPNVWSAGDCASVWHSVKQQQVYVPLATIANKLGRMVGENLAGAELEFPGTLGSAALKVLGLEAGRTGLSEKEAQQMGIDYRTVVIKDKCHTNYCSGQSDIHVKLVYEATSKRLLGGQILGRKGAVHRIDALAVAITMGVTTEQLGMLDFAYAPPFSRTWDVLNVAGNVAK